MTKIAIDCLGADGGPEVLIAGALAALKVNKNLELQLYGPQEEITTITKRLGLPQDQRCVVINAPDLISNNDNSALAVRRERHSSLVMAATAVRDGKADAFISAGSTGAVLTAGLLILGRLPAIRRPALAVVMPVLYGERKDLVMLDVGANMDSTSEDLLNYALMGSIYVTHLLKRRNPSVALLNVGTEDAKGNKLVKEAFAKIKKTDLHFIGNMEARDLMSSPADIVVCDGFAGNIALKTFEGVAKTLFQSLKDEFMSSFRTKMGAALAKPALMELRQKLDYNKYGGGFLLGLKNIAVKCHGSASAEAIAIAIDQAIAFHELELIKKFTSALNSKEE